MLALEYLVPEFWRYDWRSGSVLLMARHVRGSFFADYVRMLRRQKNVDWSKVFEPEDLGYLVQRIEPDAWYPMATFERFGVAILTHIEGATLDAVRLWGRFSVNAFVAAHPDLIAANHPVESLMRLKVLRATLFDFPAFTLPMLGEGNAYVDIRYEMGDVAEEAACHQTMGFCEGVLSLAGATNVRASFASRAWQGASNTRVELTWDTTT
jgi:hypothetical protein